jgi:hypothetical protein
MKFEDIKRIVDAHETIAKSVSATASMRAAAASVVPSAERVQGAAQLAMQHGALTPQQCAHIDTQLSLGGVAAVSADYMTILRGG